MTGSCLRQPALLGLAAHPRGELGLRRVVAGVRVGAAGVDRGRRGVGHAAAAAAAAWSGRPRRAPRRRDRRRRGRCVATHADELDVGHVHVARDLHDLVLVVALQRGELAVLHVAGEEADVPVGAEVLAVAPVVGDDVARARVGGADDLQVVLLRLGVLDPGLHRRPAGAVHLVARLLERPRHEARAPRVAGADLRGRQVLVDLRAGVDALLVHAELGLRDLQRRGADAAGARARRGGGRGVDHARHRRRGARPRSAGRRAAGRPGTRRSRPSSPPPPAAAAAMNWPESPAFGSGGGTAAAAAAGGAPAGARRRRAPARRRAGAAGATAAAAASGGGALGGDVAGRRPARVDLLLEPEVQVVLVRAVGEVAGPADRPRRADLVRPVLLRQLRQLAGQLARGARAGVDDLAVDRPDVEPAAVGVVGDRAARRELRVVRAHARDLDLVVLGDLGHRGDHARVDLARA